METNIEFLYLYTEVTIAFVAFATIVATLRQAFGNRLTPFQYLIFRMFVEVGLLLVFMAMIPVAIFHLFSDELIVWRVSTYLIIVSILIELPFHIRRRIRLSLPISNMSTTSRCVLVGWGISLLLMILTATETLWIPSIYTTTGFLIWGMIATAILFAEFLGDYIEVEEEA